MIKRITFLIVLCFTQLSFANKSSLYKFNWLDDDEVVYVLQNKEFPKLSRMGIDFNIYDSASSNYQKTTALGFVAHYSFAENLSVDFTYKSYNNEDNNDLKNLLELGESGTKPLIRKVDSAMLVHLNWTPFYGKVNTFNQIFYLDWGVGLGIGRFLTQTNYKTFEQQNEPITFITEDLSGFNFKTFFRFFTTDHYNFGIQYDLSGYTAIIDSQGTEELVKYNDLSFFVGYLF